MKDDKKLNDTFEKKLERERKARSILENEIENKMREVYLANQYTEQIVESLQSGIVVTQDKKIVRANKVFCDLLGQSQKDLCGLNFVELLSDIETREIFWNLDLSEDREIYIQNSEGTQVPILCTGTEIKNNDQTQCLLVLKDLSQIKDMEKDFTSFAQLNPSPVFRIEHSGRILMANKASNLYFQCADFSEKSWSELAPDSDFQAVSMLCFKGGTYQEELHFENFSLLVQYRALPDSNHLHAYCFDITARKKAEEESRRLQDELIKNAYSEGLAENAISVLHNIGNVLTAIHGRIGNDQSIEKLVTAGKIFGKVISHLKQTDQESNLKTSLDKVLPVLEEIALYQENAESQIDETLKFIEKNCKHIADVISTQQQYANLKNRIRSDIPVQKLVNDVLLLHQERINKRNIKVIKNISSGTVFMEKVGLSQTLSNAIVNAVEAIDEKVSGEGESQQTHHIHINAIDEGDYFSLTVEDDGIGISPEILDQLFQFGFSTKERGSGFGLHNCANYMHNNGGKIELESEGVGKGARTVLLLPKKDQAVPA